MTAVLQNHKSNSDPPARKRILAFEIQIGGHHPSYIRNFSQQWVERIPDAEVDFVVSGLFFEKHPDVVRLVQSINPETVRIHCLTEQENHRVRFESRFREFAGWNIFCDYAESLKADKALLMYSDHFQLPMLLGRAAPCPVSCIYFRPTFHYTQFHDYRPTIKQRMAAYRKKMLLSRLLKIKQLETLFCLDSFAVDFISKQFKTRANIRCLPDSFIRNPVPAGTTERLRRELGIENERRILLLLGIIDSRKGPTQLLDAVARISRQAQNRLCLLIVGNVSEVIEAEVKARVQRLRDQTPVQIVFHGQYISDLIVQQYYELADVALTTYQQHMGMSSALIRSALAGVPVLSSSYGLMGELVRKHQLGMVVDTTSPEDFAAGLDRVMSDDPQSLLDAEKALSFADDYSPEALGETLSRWATD